MQKRHAVTILLALLLGAHTGSGVALAEPCNGNAANGDTAELSVDANCTVQDGNIPTTVTFQPDSTGTLTLNGAVPTEATLGEGNVVVAADATSASTFGSADDPLASFTVNDGVTFELGHNLTASNITVGSSKVANLYQTGGTLTTNTMTIGGGCVLYQSGSGIINATNVNIGEVGTLTLVNQGTGAINSSPNEHGNLTFKGNYNTDAAIGDLDRLNSIIVYEGVTLTLDQNISSYGLYTGGGGIVNQSAGTLTAKVVNLYSGDAGGATFTQSGSGVIHAFLGTNLYPFCTLTLVNQGSGPISGTAADQESYLPTLIFAGDYTANAIIGGNSRMGNVTVNDDVTLTVNNTLRTKNLNVGKLTGATVNINDGNLFIENLFITNGSNFNTLGRGSVHPDASVVNIVKGGTMNITDGLSGFFYTTVGGTLNLGGVTTYIHKLTVNDGATLGTIINTDTDNDCGSIKDEQGDTGDTATISAASTINITVTPDTLTVGRTYNIVSLDGGITAVPTTITDNSADYDFTASFTATTLTLTVVKGGSTITND